MYAIERKECRTTKVNYFDANWRRWIGIIKLAGIIDSLVKVQSRFLSILLSLFSYLFISVYISLWWLIRIPSGKYIHCLSSYLFIYILGLRGGSPPCQIYCQVKNICGLKTKKISHIFLNCLVQPFRKRKRACIQTYRQDKYIYI